MAPQILIPLLFLHMAALLAGVAFLRSDAFAVKPPTTKALIALAMAGAMSIFVMSISEPFFLFSDFRKAYHPAGKAILESPSALAPLIGGDAFIDRFVNLPIVAYLFAPFGAISLVSLKGAAATFMLLGIGMTLWAWWILCREAKLDNERSWLLLFLFAANGPLIYSFKEGNTSQMVLFGLVAALALLKDRRDAWAGVVLGVCALIKLPLLIFGVYFVLRRNWHAVFGFSALLAVSGLLSLVVFGWELNWIWFDTSVLQFSRNAIGAYNVQSVLGFVLRLETGAPLLRDWSVVDISTTQRIIGRTLVIAMAIAAVLACLRRPAASDTNRRAEWDNLEFSLVVTLAILASPLSWTHYYCWLLIPIAFLLNWPTARAGRQAGSWAAWAAIILVSPVVAILAFPEHPIMQMTYAKLLVSNYLAGAIVLFGLLVWALARGFPREFHAAQREANVPAQ